MNDELTTFIDRATKSRNRNEQIFNWHVKAGQAGIPLPYDYDDTYTSINVYDYENEDNKWEINVEKTLDMIAKVVQFATDNGYEVTKSYNYNFDVCIIVNDDVEVHYTAQRESVCTKKVVGTKVIPAKVTEERIEEEIEWECEKIAFLAREV